MKFEQLPESEKDEIRLKRIQKGKLRILIRHNYFKIERIPKRRDQERKKLLFNLLVKASLISTGQMKWKIYNKKLASKIFPDGGELKFGKEIQKSTIHNYADTNEALNFAHVKIRFTNNNRYDFVLEGLELNAPLTTNFVQLLGKQFNRTVTVTSVRDRFILEKEPKSNKK